MEAKEPLLDIKTLNILDWNKELFEAGKQEGRKEAMEWFIKHNKSIWGGFSADIDISELQAQLQEWGIA